MTTSENISIEIWKKFPAYSATSWVHALVPQLRNEGGDRISRRTIPTMEAKIGGYEIISPAYTLRDLLTVAQVNKIPYNIGFGVKGDLPMLHVIVGECVAAHAAAGLEDTFGNLLVKCQPSPGSKD